MTCANHVFDVHIEYVMDDEGRDWHVSGCKCGVRNATIMVSDRDAPSNIEVPAVVYGKLFPPPDDELLHKCHTAAEEIIDK